MRNVVVVIGLICLALLGTSADAVAPTPTPDQATVRVTKAFCEYEPTSDKIKAKGALKTTVKQLDDDEFYYLVGRIVVDGRKPGGAWKPVAEHRTSSAGFELDELPFRWRAFASVVVPSKVADERELSLRYRIRLMFSDTGKDPVVWSLTGRSSEFECGDG